MLELLSEGNDAAKHFYQRSFCNSICSLDAKPVIKGQIDATNKVARATKYRECESFEVKYNYYTSAKSFEIVHAGNGETYSLKSEVAYPANAKELDPEYTLPRTTFTEKDIIISRMENMYIIGKYGFTLQVEPECVVYTGDHMYTLPIPQNYFDRPEKYPDLVVVEEPAVLLTQPYTTNYYHTTIEALSRVLVAKDYFVAKGMKIKLFVNFNESNVYEDILKFLGMDQYFEIVNINGEVEHLLKDVYVLEWLHKDVPIEEETDSWQVAFPPKYALQKTYNALHMRDTPITAQDPNWKVFFIRREKFIYRHVLPSDDKLIEALEHMIGKEHFVADYLFSKNFAQQRELFADVAMLVGPHGAGFSNMIFMPPGSSVVSFPMRPSVDSCFANIAAALGFDYHETPFFHAFYYGNFHLTDYLVDHVVDAVYHLLTQKGFPVANPPKPMAYNATHPTFKQATESAFAQLEAEYQQLSAIFDGL